MIFKQAPKVRKIKLFNISQGLNHIVREEEKNNLPQMKPLFFLYVSLNLTRIAGLRKENLVKEIK